MKTAEVLPGKGLGPLRFGMAMAEVNSILGDPPSKTYEEDGEYSYWLWEYPQYGIYLFFRSSENFRLTSVEIDSESGANIFGAPLFPATRDTIVHLLRRNLSSEQFESIEEQTSTHTGEVSLHAPAIRGIFYFDEFGIMQQFHWGPFFDPTDEIIWPETK